MPRNSFHARSVFTSLLISFLLCIANPAAAQEEEPPAGLQANPPADAQTATPATQEPAESEPGSDNIFEGDEWSAAFDEMGRDDAAADESDQSDAASDGDQRGPADTYSVMLDVVKWLAILFAAFFVAMVLFRSVGRKTKILPAADIADVIGRIYLTSNTSVHFVRTAGRVLVVGVAPNHVALLTEMEADSFSAVDTAESGPAPKSATAARFLDELKSQQSKMQPIAPKASDGDEEIDSLRTDIARIQRLLREEPRRDAGQ